LAVPEPVEDLVEVGNPVLPVGGQPEPGAQVLQAPRPEAGPRGGAALRAAHGTAPPLQCCLRRPWGPGPGGRGRRTWGGARGPTRPAAPRTRGRPGRRGTPLSRGRRRPSARVPRSGSSSSLRFLPFAQARVCSVSLLEIPLSLMRQQFVS